MICPDTHEKYLPTYTFQCGEKSVKCYAVSHECRPKIPAPIEPECICPIGRRAMLVNPDLTVCPNTHEKYLPKYTHKCGKKSIECSALKHECRLKLPKGSTPTDGIVTSAKSAVITEPTTEDTLTIDETTTTLKPTTTEATV